MRVSPALMPERPYTTSSQYARHEAIMRDFVEMEE